MTLLCKHNRNTDKLHEITLIFGFRDSQIQEELLLKTAAQLLKAGIWILKSYYTNSLQW